MYESLIIETQHSSGERLSIIGCRSMFTNTTKLSLFSLEVAISDSSIHSTNRLEPAAATFFNGQCDKRVPRTKPCEDYIFEALLCNSRYAFHELSPAKIASSKLYCAIQDTRSAN